MTCVTPERGYYQSIHCPGFIHRSLPISPAILMAHPLNRVSPFYEPGALKVVPRLLAQTDILLHGHLLRRLLKDEELSLETSGGAVRRRYASTHPSSQPYVNAVAFKALSRSPSPQSRPPTPAPSSTPRSAQSAKAKHSARLPDEDEDEAEDAAETSDNSESTANSRSGRHIDGPKIQKPRGEVGRPGSGGYNLEHELALHPRSFKELKVWSYCPS